MADTKKAPAKKSAAKKDKVVGGATHPENLRVPESVLIKRPKAEDEGVGAKVTTSPEVLGDKAMMIIELPQGKPLLAVVLLEGLGLTPVQDGRMIFVQGTVSSDFFNVAQAKGKFAVKKDGTVIFNARGFDDVPHADFDLVDIVALMEHNNSSKGKADDKKIDDATAKADKKKLADEKKAADKKAADDKKAAAAAAKANK